MQVKRNTAGSNYEVKCGMCRHSIDRIAEAGAPASTRIAAARILRSAGWEKYGRWGWLCAHCRSSSRKKHSKWMPLGTLKAVPPLLLEEWFWMAYHKPIAAARRLSDSDAAQIFAIVRFDFSPPTSPVVQPSPISRWPENNPLWMPINNPSLLERSPKGGPGSGLRFRLDLPGLE
jgi:hypothetical protein